MFGKIQSKKTLDQYIADMVAGDTPLRSIEVGTEDMGTSVGACDGFPCTFFNTLAWRTDTSPLPVAINPRVTFERMFGEAGASDSVGPGSRRDRACSTRSAVRPAGSRTRSAHPTA
jgi:hypothetical protein